MLQVRTDMARQMGQKAEAMRKQVHDESLRYEGAVGCLAQVRDMLGRHQLKVREAFAEQGQDKEVSAGKMAVLTAAIADLDVLAETAKAQLAGQRGKAQQAEATLDMLEAMFSADIAQAQAMVEGPDGEPQDTGRHPGAGLAAQRKAEAEQGDDGNPGS